jgi:hypothetical protein
MCDNNYLPDISYQLVTKYKNTPIRLHLVLDLFLYFQIWFVSFIRKDI